MCSQCAASAQPRSRVSLSNVWEAVRAKGRAAGQKKFTARRASLGLLYCMTREGKEPMAPAPSAPCEPSAPAEPSAPGEPSSAEPVGEQHESHAEKLTYESFCKLAREREGVAASDVELRARFAALDLDGSGKADLNEYNCHCLREALRRSSSRVIDLFRSWDVDGSGEVDREEFRRAIRQLNLDYVADDAAIDRMFALFDDDDNGTLEYHELRKQLSVGAGKTLEPLLRPGAVDLGPSGLKHRLRRRDSIAKGTKMVRRASVDLRGNQTVQEQLKAVLRANVARVIDLFREWDDDGNGTISKKEFRQGLNNEADMAAFASYMYAGRTDRAQEVLHAVKTYSYGLGRGGLAGNEDSGGEASWYVHGHISDPRAPSSPLATLAASPVYGSVGPYLPP